jgi:transcriptional regulator of arginine metabolism
VKYLRQAKILEMIRQSEIEKQEEIAEKLKEMGLSVTQATVSRDIKELNLVKVMTPLGKYKYASYKKPENMISPRWIKVFEEAFVSCDFVKNTVVLKTLSGMGSAVGEVIDGMEWEEVLGCIAGDNTIMMVCRSDEEAYDVVTRLKNLARQRQG